MTLSRFTLHALAITLTSLVLLVIWQASMAVVILACSLALVAAIGPIIDALVQRGWPRFLAIGATLTSLLALVVVVGLALFSPLLRDLDQMGQDVALGLTRLQQTQPDHWLLHLGEMQSETSTNGTEAAVSETVLQDWLMTILGTASGLFEIIASLGVCLALALYWLLDRQRLERLWFTLVPIRQRAGAEKVWQSIQREIGAYLRSELIQTLCAVFLLWIGFETLGLRYAALTALVAAFLSLLPWIGTLFAVATVLALSSAKVVEPTAPWLEIPGYLAALHTLVVLCFLEFWVEPRLFQRDRYSPLITALVTLAMTMMGGLWGLLFGPPVGYVVQITWRLLYPLVFTNRAEPASLAAIECRLEELQERVASAEEVPPEIVSLVRRLQTIVDSQSENAASDNEEPAEHEFERAAIN